MASRSAFIVGMACFAAGCTPATADAAGQDLGMSAFEQSGQDEAICGAKVSPIGASEPDSVRQILVRIASLFDEERSVFRLYQGIFCSECDALEGASRPFFSSSTHALRQLARAFPDDAAAQCALGEALLREASLGDGDFDLARVGRARSALERAAALSPDADIARRIEERLRFIEALGEAG